MKKIKIRFGTIIITEKTKRLITKLLDETRISQGKLTKKFEEKFAQTLGVKEAVAVSSGTDAITLALAVLYDYGAKRGNEVIVPALSFVSTGAAILHAGFKPVFVDIKRETLNIDTSKIEEAITENTIAILPVHLMGKAAEMDTILEIAQKYNLKVIEDTAEGYGTLYKGKPAGTFGDMGTFSTYIAHMITTGEGGIVITNNEEYANILRSLRAHGRACNCKVCVLSTASNYCPKRFRYESDVRFLFERVGFSSKMNELEAAIGLGSLELYEEILQKRLKNFWYLHNALKEFKDYFYLPKEEKYERIGPHAFPIILKENVKFSRDEMMQFLEEKGIETRTLFSSMPTQCPAFKFMGYKLGDFPEAEYVGNNGLHIGIHQDLKKEDLDYVVDIIREFLMMHGG
ncbi:MAG TPA: DegT/DnrJ/EryC1/StrS family aminotransferase [Candidatus Desulfofervidus auxilii]|uniref:DegT/DnrJ/EryC1/StrS family aminotransferase n=1 Tax=Desulfofervidus auxilii TaxID=1621989 RepID=A0A7C0Y7V1_DESA2|nr:DegT/DnrJ/EryC1/StrS family aminotransferase [Candidatus Desulfofervidus auxilii]